MANNKKVASQIIRRAEKGIIPITILGRKKNITVETSERLIKAILSYFIQ